MIFVRMITQNHYYSTLVSQSRPTH